jgi:dihydrofolate synthase/folylpolyglutamate synthase
VALTWFERSFAVAVVLAGQRPGIRFLVEVGLGGRLDCANALDAAVAVITHLSHDHRDVLGPTLCHIASEKLPIARPGRPLVIAAQSSAAEAAIREALATGVAAGAVIHRPPPGEFTLSLAGEHQQANAAAALLAARLLRGDLDEPSARAAMAQVVLPARCQVIEHEGRRLLIDGAHNGPSIAATMAVAQERLRPGFTVILGLARDKEVEEVLAALPAGVTVHRCGYDSTRARGPQDWPGQAQAWPWYDRIAEALAAVPGDVCVTGSFYLTGEALAVGSPRNS